MGIFRIKVSIINDGGFEIAATPASRALFVRSKEILFFCFYSHAIENCTVVVAAFCAATQMRLVKSSSKIQYA